MFGFLKRVLSDEELKKAEEQAAQAAGRGDDHGAWDAVQPLMAIQAKQRAAALSLLRIVNAGDLSPERAFEVLEAIEARYADDIEIIGSLGDALECASEIDFLNRPAPDRPLFQRVIDTLAKAAEDPRHARNEAFILQGLATAARLAGRKADEIAERAYKRLVELDPDNNGRRYGYGLFLKTRGRFRDGMEQNQKARELSDEIVNAQEWNFGICATGAGEGAAALDVWKRLGNRIEMGRFGLPEGSYPRCKARLAQRPLAERGAENDDPGREETVWIERLSPCHGIIRSVLYQDLGVDYGDVILIDGAPVTYHKYGDDEIPVFPHLATLKRMNYQFFDFAGTQSRARELMEKSAALAEDAVIYSHTEQYRTLCASCWRDPTVQHERHEEMQKHVVVGRIAAPPSIDAARLLQNLDEAMNGAEGCSIYAPALCAAAGDETRASMERRRYDMLVGN